MIACALIPESTVDDDEVGRRPGGHDLTGGGQAHQQTAPTREQFFSHQDCERGADYSTHNSDLNFANRERIEFGVVAGPVLKGSRLVGLSQLSNDIAIRV
jgi:hypothetical protein